MVYSMHTAGLVCHQVLKLNGFILDDLIWNEGYPSHYIFQRRQGKYH